MNSFRTRALFFLMAAAILCLPACEKERKGGGDGDEEKAASPERAEPKAAPSDEEAPAKPELTNLVKSALAGNDDLEVIVSHVVIPAGFELPTHYHPGQEFIYVQEGTLTMKLKGESDQSVEPGEAFVVPPEAVHSGVAKGGEVTVVVFRVHDREKPVRYVIKPDGKEVPLDH